MWRISGLGNAVIFRTRGPAALHHLADDLDEQILARTKQDAGDSSDHNQQDDRPLAFTEHGARRATNILNSPRAVQMSVVVIRAFVKMRETLLGARELAKKLAAFARLGMTIGSQVSPGRHLRLKLPVSTRN